MGRSKLAIMYREQSRARINTYKTRIKGLEKKAKELSVLCGVDVLFSSFSPDLNAIHSWPKEPSEFYRIINRYKSISSQKSSREVPSLQVNSSSQEELVAINKKLEEVRQMITFLEAEEKASSSQHNGAHSEEADEDYYASVSVVNEDEDIYSMLEELGEGLIVPDLPSIPSANICNGNYFDWNFCTESFFGSDSVIADLMDMPEASADFQF